MPHPQILLTYGVIGAKKEPRAVYGIEVVLDQYSVLADMVKISNVL